MLDWLVAFFCLYSGLCVPDACREIDFERNEYQVCSFRMTDVSLRTFHVDQQGEAYGSLSRLQRSLSETPQMLMNGGMYHDDLSPVGLYIEDSKQIQRISTKGGWGNFHLLPNGVFWIKNNKAHVSDTKRYLRANPQPDFATQSGPMLVINGKLHPRFLKDSDSLKIRNGVGVSADGNWVHFAISKGSVNFWDFGKLFQQELQTPNALFLDGTVSALRSKNFRRGGWRLIGPIIGVFDKREE